MRTFVSFVSLWNPTKPFIYRRYKITNVDVKEIKPETVNIEDVCDDPVI